MVDIGYFIKKMGRRGLSVHSTEENRRNSWVVRNLRTGGPKFASREKSFIGDREYYVFLWRFREAGRKRKMTLKKEWRIIITLMIHMEGELKNGRRFRRAMKNTSNRRINKFSCVWVIGNYEGYWAIAEKIICDDKAKKRIPRES